MLNGKTRRLPALEVMLRRLANDAMRNDHRAIKLLIDLLERYGDAPEATLPVNELIAEDQEILKQYLGTPAKARLGRSARTAKRKERTNGD